MKNRFIVLDTETTGLSIKKGNRIIEIAIIEIINSEITGKEFHSYFYVKKKISKKSYKIHKINNSFLKNKKKFSEKYKEMNKFMGNSIIIAHNAKFDSKFIKNEIKLIKKKKKMVFVDTLKIFRKIFPGKKNNLENISKRFGFKINFNLHNALNDARLLSRVIITLMRKQKKIKSRDIL
ncbi:exonuclease domain-containing protein [Candidatus Vidania fulgoroideorum]